MALKRDARSRSGMDNEEGTGVVQETNKWGRVAEMIGESLEFVCKMGQQERNELVLLLPVDDGDGIANSYEDATIEELLESDKEEKRTEKRRRPVDPLSETPKKRFVLLSTPKNKVATMTPKEVKNGSEHPRSPTRPDATASGSKLTPTSSSSPYMKSNINKIFASGLISPRGVSSNENLEEVMRSPIFKGRIKNEFRSQNFFDVDNLDVQNCEQIERDQEESLKLQLDSDDSLTENLEELPNLHEHDVPTTFLETGNASPIHELTKDSDNQQEKDTMSDKKHIEADKQKMKTASDSKQSTRSLVIHKIILWNDYYKFTDLNFIHQNVLSMEDCFDILEENPEKYNFKEVSTEINLERESSFYVEDVKKCFSAVKNIKSQSTVQCGPAMVTVYSGKGNVAFGNSGVAKIKNTLSSYGLDKADNYLSSRKMTRSRAKDSVVDELNIEVYDSSDDFEDNKDAGNSDGLPGKKKAKRGRPRKLTGEKTRPALKARNPSGRKLLSNAEIQQRLDVSPLERENVGNEKQWLGKGSKGNGMRGKKNGGYGIGRGKSGATGVDSGESVATESLDNLSSAASPRKPFGGEGFFGLAEESRDDDDVQVISVVKSPAAKSLNNGGNDVNLRFSGHEKARRKLSQLGNISVTRSSSMETEAGDSLSDFQIKKEAKGECPMCQQEIWMYELERHAAECEGGAHQ